MVADEGSGGEGCPGHLTDTLHHLQLPPIG